MDYKKLFRIAIAAILGLLLYKLSTNNNAKRHAKR